MNLLILVAVMLLGLLAFGPATIAAWLDQMPLLMRIARDGLVGWHKLVSVYAAAREAGVPEQAALLLHGTVALTAAAFVAVVWRSRAEPKAKAGVLAAASMLASPYVYLYDALVVVPAFVWLVHCRTPVWLVAALWLLPILIIIQTGLGGSLNIGPVLPLGLLAVSVAEWRRSESTRNKQRLAATR